MKHDIHSLVQLVKNAASELGHIPNRDEFLRHSGVSNHQIKNAGGYAVVINATGLRQEKPTKNNNPLKNQFAKFDAVDKLGENYEKEIKPFVGKYERAQGIGDKILMVASDFHAWWSNRFALNVFCDTALRLQPDYISLAGDVLDFFAISRYDKDPRRIFSLDSELDFVKKHIFCALRQACPKAQIDLILGNHEVRLWKYLVQNAPALSALQCLKLPQLLSLDDFQINLIARPSIITSKEKEQENWKIYERSFVVTHGTATGRGHALTELDKFKLSGCSGHVHHYQAQTRVFLSQDGRPQNCLWTSMGSMAKDEVAYEYAWDFPRQNNGFMIVHFISGEPNCEYIHVGRQSAHVGGIYYRTKGDEGGIIS